MKIESATRIPRWPMAAMVLAGSYLLMAWLAQRLTSGGGPSLPDLCLFHRVTALPCPFCGTTRMALSAMHGDLWAALSWNPLVFVGCVVTAGLLVLQVVFSRRVIWASSFRRRQISYIVLIALVLANWTYLLAREL